MTPTPNDAGHLPAEDLVAWVDGELTGAEAERAARHVAACAACGREADLLRRSGDLIARLPGHAPPAGFDARVAAAVQGSAPTPVTTSRGRLLRGRFGAVAAAAAVLVAVAGGAWLATRSADPEALTAREEEEIARDLFVLAHLDTLRSADDELLATLADDLDVLDAAADLLPEGEDG